MQSKDTQPQKKRLLTNKKSIKQIKSVRTLAQTDKTEISTQRIENKKKQSSLSNLIISESIREKNMETPERSCFLKIVARKKDQNPAYKTDCRLSLQETLSRKPKIGKSMTEQNFNKLESGSLLKVEKEDEATLTQISKKVSNASTSVSYRPLESDR